MKTAKQPVPDGASGSNRRAQPVRQTRVNPPRTSSLNRVNPLSTAPAPEQPINILPGVTHFTDAITALPKELVRHFTLLKEVDAKIFAPEAALFQLLQDTLNTPALDANGTLNDTASSAASVAAVANAQSGGGTSNNTATGAANPPAPPSDGTGSSVFDPANIPRRTLFRDTAFKIQGMLVALEEKNHLIATANDALQKQLSRIEDIWPHLEAEFSDEAKWGSTTHWAYVENRQAKVSDKQAERSRREGAATLSAAAQQLAEEAAARSNDRKQALAAKKNSKNQAADAEPDKAQESGKKSQGAKSRKPLPDSGPVGLGITTGPAGPAPPTKRRKVETAKANGGAAVERAMGTVFGNSASKPQKTSSPRETPAPESGSKKRKALPTSSGQTKKSRTNATMSPSVTSSPVIGAFPDPARIGRASPAPSTSAPRPASSRARQNSMQSSVDGTRQRPASATSNKPNGNQQGTPDPGLPSNGAKANADVKAQKETALPALKPSLTKQETEEFPSALELAPNGGRKEVAAKASENGEQPKETAQLAIQPPPPSVSMVKTKSGRASKPSTPAIATFAEAATNSGTSTMTSARSRPSRNTDSGASTATSTATTSTTGSVSGNGTTTTAKRSHKKGASISAAAAALAQQAAQQQQPSAAASAAGQTIAADKDSHKDSKDRDSIAATGGKKERDRDRDRDGVVHAHSASSSHSTHARSGSTSHANNNNSSSNNGSNSTKNDRNASSSSSTARVKAEAAEEEEEEEEQDNADEDLYCYCNQVSYGEMVACDGEGCPREWFHLECVGLKVAPKGNAKWYCEDCKKRLKIAERR